MNVNTKKRCKGDPGGLGFVIFLLLSIAKTQVLVGYGSHGQVLVNSPLEEKKVRFGLVNCFLFVDLE